MGYVSRDDGTRVQINDKIVQTEFALPKDEDISSINILAKISEAIARLEEYGKLVDNCGYTNCCQSCQQYCSECGGECKECIENGCSQCLNCEEADPRKMLAVPEIAEQAYVTRQPSVSKQDEFLLHGPSITNAKQKGLITTGDTTARYKLGNHTYKIRYSLSDKTKYKWNGYPDDYVHEISWKMNAAQTPVPIVFRYTVFEDFNYDRYHYTFNGRTIDKIAIPLGESQVLQLPNSFAIGPKQPLITRTTRAGYSCNRLIVEFFVPGQTNKINNLAYYYYEISQDKNYLNTSRVRESASVRVPLNFGTITGAAAHTAFARYFTSNLYPIGTPEQDMWYFWIDLLYMGQQDAKYYNVEYDQEDSDMLSRKTLSIFSFDITSCSQIGIPKASYSFVLTWNAFQGGTEQQGELFLGALPVCKQEISSDHGQITVNGPADIIKYEGTIQNDYSQDLNLFEYTVI